MKSFKQFVAESVEPLGLHNFPVLATLPHIQSQLHNPRCPLTRFMTLANAAISRGSLIKAELSDIKYVAGALKEASFKDHSEKYRYAGKWSSLPAPLQNFDFEPNNMTLVSSNLKKLEAIKVDHPAKTDAIAILKELVQVETVLNWLKDKIVARQTKAQKDAEAAYRAPQSTKDAKKLVADVLTLMTNEVKEQYIVQTETPWLEEIAKFFAKEHADQLRHIGSHPEQDKARDERNKAARKAHQERTGRTWGFQAEPRYPHWVESLLHYAAVVERHKSSYGDPMYGKPVWTPYPDWKKRIHKLAVEQAEAMQQAFIEKNVRKLASIVEVKGNIDGDPKVLNVGCRSGIIEGNIKFTFKDRSSFIVRNKIVSKGYEAGGVWKTMYQFPTTFHDAILPDGKRMPGQPSEKEMNEVFGKAAR